MLHRRLGDPQILHRAANHSGALPQSGRRARVLRSLRCPFSRFCAFSASSSAFSPFQGLQAHHCFLPVTGSQQFGVGQSHRNGLQQLKDNNLFNPDTALFKEPQPEIKR